MTLEKVVRIVAAAGTVVGCVGGVAADALGRKDREAKIIEETAKKVAERLSENK